MVSVRCKMIVKSTLVNMGLHYTIVELGEVEINEKLVEDQQNQLRAALLKFGLELISDKKALLVEKIKNAIIEMVDYSYELPAVNFSDHLSNKLSYDYTYLSNLFSEVKGTTIEHFVISHRIERVKELLGYNELSITEIAQKLHYSSVSHLSSQFKKITGLTPSFFKKMKYKRLISLENL